MQTYPDDDELITYDWVASNFPSKGAAYSARQHPACIQLVWLDRFERFTLYNASQTHLKTRGDVRRLVAALGCPLSLDKPSDPDAAKHNWLEI